MLDLLNDKKVIFFDVGYTLDKPASSDWMFTNQFLELASEKMKQRIKDEFALLAKDQDFVLPEISFQSYSYDNSRKLKRVERIAH